jgi:flagellar motility protein MotE (MotC chaperone)
MRRARMLLLVTGLAGKVALLGAWWWTSVARAENPAHGVSAARVPPELLERSRGFRELLAAVEQRGRELDRRERAVAAREAALNALAATLGEQIARLEPGTAPGSGGGAVAGGRPCGVTVAKIYQSMSPEDAAAILDRLDDATATSIFAGMRERQIAAILALMDHDRAVALTKALAGSF